MFVAKESQLCIIDILGGKFDSVVYLSSKVCLVFAHITASFYLLQNPWAHVFLLKKGDRLKKALPCEMCSSISLRHV